MKPSVGSTMLMDKLVGPKEGAKDFKDLAEPMGVKLVRVHLLVTVFKNKCWIILYNIYRF